MGIQTIQSLEDYSALLEKSVEQPVFLLKHSLVCPISRHSYNEYEKFAQANSDTPCYLIRIQENRELSGHVASETGITHESPQVLMYSQGRAVWHESHHMISEKRLQKTLGGDDLEP